jgi:hypothetical protein
MLVWEVPQDPQAYSTQLRDQICRRKRRRDRCSPTNPRTKENMSQNLNYFVFNAQQHRKIKINLLEESHSLLAMSKLFEG